MHSEAEYRERVQMHFTKSGLFYRYYNQYNIFKEKLDNRLVSIDNDIIQYQAAHPKLRSD